MVLSRIDTVEVIPSDWGDTGAETTGKTCCFWIYEHIRLFKNLRQAMKEERMPLLRNINCEFTIKKEREMKHRKRGKWKSQNKGKGGTRTFFRQEEIFRKAGEVNARVGLFAAGATTWCQSQFTPGYPTNNTVGVFFKYLRLRIKFFFVIPSLQLIPGSEQWQVLFCRRNSLLFFAMIVASV